MWLAPELQIVSQSMSQMLRYAVRSLGRTPNFTMAALSCLALGIGATSAIFSIVNGVVLRPLPYPESNRLVRIYTEFPTFPNGGLHKFWVSDAEVFDLQKSAKSFDLIGASQSSGVNLGGLHQPTRVSATFVSSHQQARRCAGSAAGADALLRRVAACFRRRSADHRQGNNR
jgi:hypothetical protein